MPKFTSANHGSATRFFLERARISSGGFCMRYLVAIGFACLTLCACSKNDSSPVNDRVTSSGSPTPIPIHTVRNGFWGNGSARLEVNDAISRLELGCAHGDIARFLVLDTQGNFSADGAITGEAGPDPQGGRPSHPARFDGQVIGNSMHLEVSYNINGSASRDKFDLVFGNSRLPIKCRSPQTSSWNSVREHATCEALNPMFCKGAYGFNVDNTGAFTCGPNQAGQVTHGQILANELSELSTQAQAVNLTSNQSVCQPSERLPGSDDTINLASSSGANLLVYDWTGALGRTCYKGELTSSKKLHDDLNALMLKYYPVQF
jgi:hypothetical protein